VIARQIEEHQAAVRRLGEESESLVLLRRQADQEHRELLGRRGSATAAVLDGAPGAAEALAVLDKDIRAATDMIEAVTYKAIANDGQARELEAAITALEFQLAEANLAALGSEQADDLARVSVLLTEAAPLVERLYRRSREATAIASSAGLPAATHRWDAFRMPLQQLVEGTLGGRLEFAILAKPEARGRQAEIRDSADDGQFAIYPRELPDPFPGTD